MRETKRHKLGKKALSLLLALSMLVGLLPAISISAAAANEVVDKTLEDIEVRVGRMGVIGNATISAYSIAAEFSGKKSGWSSTGLPGVQNGAYQLGGDLSRSSVFADDSGGLSILNNDGNSRGDKTANFTIDLTKIDVLNELSYSSTATVTIEGRAVGDHGTGWKRRGRVYVDVYDKNGRLIKNATTDEATGYGGGDTKHISFSGGNTFQLSEIGKIKVTVFSANMKGYKSSGDPAGMSDFKVLVKDTTRPALNLVTYGSNGITQQNAGTGANELLMPEFVARTDEDTRAGYESAYLDMKLDFTKTVKSEYYTDMFKNIPQSDEWKAVEGVTIHSLFTNPLSTGLKRAGQNANMVLYQVTNRDGVKTENIKNFKEDNGGGAAASDYYMGNEKNLFGGDRGTDLLGGYIKTMSYRYTTMYGDNYGSNPVPHTGEWRADATDAVLNMNGGDKARSFYQKLNDASFHDAAGNYLRVTDSTNVKNGMTNTTDVGANPFDPAKNGYNVIVDAVPPTYTKTGNAIQPDILTNLVLTDANKVNFQVNFSEPVTVKKYNSGTTNTGTRPTTNWDVTNTYLQMNNGQRAYYVKGDSSKTWSFLLDMGTITGESGTAALTDKVSTEIPTLKALALTNEGRPNDTRTAGSDTNVTPGMPKDTYTITDYVGNPLMQKANTENPGADGSFEYEEPVKNDQGKIMYAPNADGSGTPAALTGSHTDTVTDPTTGNKTVTIHGLYDDVEDKYKAYETANTPTTSTLMVGKTSGQWDALMFSADGAPIYWTQTAVDAIGGALWNDKNTDGTFKYVVTDELLAPTAVESQREMITGSFAGENPGDEAYEPTAVPYIRIVQERKDGDGVGTGVYEYAQQEVLDSNDPTAPPTMEKLWSEVTGLTFVNETNFPLNGVVGAPVAMPEEPAVDAAQDVKDAYAAAKTAYEAANTAYTDSGASGLPTLYTAAITASATKIEGKDTTNTPQVLATAEADAAAQVIAYNKAMTDFETAAKAYADLLKAYDDALKAYDSTKSAYDPDGPAAWAYADPLLAYHKSIYDYASDETTNQLAAGTPQFKQKTEKREASESSPIMVEETTVTTTWTPKKMLTQTKTVIFEGERYNTKIDWARLSVDNTKPNNVKPYSYKTKSGSVYASDSIWGKTGGITFNITDPKLKINPLDPTYNASSNFEKDSMGIYRPMNVTGGSSSSATGLVYYMWSQTEPEPAVLSQNNYAAIKQFALTGVQPMGLTNGDTLGVANNISNVVAPAARQIATNTSGVWYLHYWTADMSWDSARQLIQYNMMKTWRSDNCTAWVDAYNGAVTNATFKINISNLTFSNLSPETQASLLQQLGKTAGYTPTQGEILGLILANRTSNGTRPGDAGYTDVVYPADGGEAVTNWQWTSDGESAALVKAMESVGKYSEWNASLFQNDDSNWIHGAAVMKLDNKAPTQVSATVAGENATFTVTDDEGGTARSGLKAVYYQYVQVKDKDDKPVANTPPGMNSVDWVLPGEPVTAGTFNAYTSGNVNDFGTYQLYIKVEDAAGNAAVIKAQNSGTDVTVKVTAGTVKGVFDFTVNDAATAAKKLDAKFTLSTSSANAFSAKYIVTQSPVRPTNTKDYKNATGGGAAVGGSVVFTIPTIEGKSGQCYLHVTVTETIPNGVPKEYYFSQTYFFDNTAPTIAFSTNSVPYPLEAQAVTVTVDDDSALAAEGAVKYVWLLAGDTNKPVDGTYAGWNNATLTDKKFDATMSVKDENGVGFDDGTYVLYVYALDQAGNGVVMNTGEFILKKNVGPAIPEEITSQLIYTGGDQQNGFYGIAKVEFDATNKEGYQYSMVVAKTNNLAEVQADTSLQWSRWSPYTNFVRFTLPVTKLSDLQDGSGWYLWVKFPDPSGKVSEDSKAYACVDLSTVITEVNPVYALANRDQLKKLSETALTGATITADAKVVTLKLELPSGVTAEAMPYVKDFDGKAQSVDGVNANPYPVAKGANLNEFKVARNGCYAFSITYPLDTARNTVLLAVVDNFDNEAPVGSVSYSVTTPTASNVVATLTTSEPVRITSGDGKATHTFTANDSFTFTFEDEAGNQATVVATVANIKKDAPAATLEMSYDQFGSIKDGDAVKAAQGVLMSMVENATGSALTIVSATGGTVDRATNTVTVTANGKVTITAADKLGNTVSKTETVSNLIPAIPMPTITYSFVKEDGVTPVDKIITIDGVQYSKGSVKAAVSGTVEGLQQGNAIFSGLKPVVNASGSNQISDAVTGAYTWNRVYSTNGSTNMVLSDALGNTLKVPMVIAGLDNDAPVLTLNAPSVSVQQNKENFDWKSDLGGFSATDNVSSPTNIKVTFKDTTKMNGKDVKLDLTTIGRYVVSYTAVDELGNSITVEQNVFVLPGDGMLILGNGNLVAAANPESVLLDSNVVHFEVSKHDLMTIGGAKMVNQAAKYDIYYVEGLYREGQMKYIAEDVSLEELVSNDYTITFPKSGWYTIIVRNQEREREFTSIFISSAGG